MIPKTQRRVVLTSYLTGEPTESVFRLKEGPVPEPGPGQVLVRTLYLALDPYMRGVLGGPDGVLGLKSKPGEPMRGGAVGEVVKSNHPDFSVGDIVEDRMAWEEYTLAPNALLRKVDRSFGPISTANTVLGMPGMTAYFGLFEFAEMKSGETVVVSGASGAVGSVAVQIAKIAGCKVVGIAGGKEKCAYLTDTLGLDGAIDYKAERDIEDAVRRLCPGGVDVYFDLTGGLISDGVIANMRLYGRIALVGSSAHAAGPGPRQMGSFVGGRITARGFIIFDHVARWEPAIRIVGQWLQQGRIKYEDDIVDGLENAPRTFVAMLRGEIAGKPQIRVAAER